MAGCGSGTGRSAMWTVGLVFGRSGRWGFNRAAAAMRWVPDIGRKSSLNDRFLTARTAAARPLRPIEQSEGQRQVAKYSGHSRRPLTGSSSAEAVVQSPIRQRLQWGGYRP